MPTYKQLIDLAKPVDYWRADDGNLTTVDDDFESYSNGTDPGTIEGGRWEAYGSGGINEVREVNNGGLDLSVEAADAAIYLKGLYNKYELHGDFDIEFELDNWVGSGTAHPYILLIMAHDVDDTGTSYTEEYLGMYGNGINAYVSGGTTTETGSLSEDGGRFRATRVGTTVTTYRWTGSWTQISQWTGRSGGPTGIVLRVQNGASVGATATGTFLNFQINSADAITPRTVKSEGVYSLRYFTPLTNSPGLISSDPVSLSWTFNGTDQYIASRNILNYRSTDTQGSIEAWINLSSAAVDGTKPIFSSTDEASTLSSFLLDIIVTSGVGKLRFGQKSTGAWNFVVGDTDILVGNNYHVVAISDGSAYSLYVNGVEQSLTITQGTNTGDWFSDTPDRDHVLIGALINTAPVAYFPGTIDEVAYYDRPLTQPEISKHYSVGKYNEEYPQKVVDDDPTHYWRLGEPSGTTCVDEVGGFQLTYTDVTLAQTSLVPTLTNTAGLFNGTTSHAKADLPTSLKVTSPSYEGWASTDTGGVIAAGVPHQAGSVGKGYSIGISTTTGFGYVRAAGPVAESYDFCYGTTDLRDGQPHHIVGTYDGSNLRIYVDGQQQNSVAYTKVIDWVDGSGGGPDPGQFYLGGERTNVVGTIPNNGIFPGTIDEVAAYDYPLTANQVLEHYNAGIKDYGEYTSVVMNDTPTNYWPLADYNEDLRNCVLYMNFEGEQGTTFFENLQNPEVIASRLGDAAINAQGSKWGKSCFYCDGTLDQATFPHSTDWELGGSDYTIDCWIYLNSYASTSSWRCIVSHHAGTLGWRFLIGDQGQLHLSANDGIGNGFHGSAGDVPLNTWTHIAAIATNGGTLSIGYVNGIEVGRASGHFINTLTNVLRIGATDSGSFIMHGSIDDLRILKGRADWTTNFTPPTRAHGVNTISNGYLRDSTLTNWTTLGGIVTATSSRINISRNGAAYGAHGVYQKFSTIPGEVYEIEAEVVAASHLSVINIYTDISFTVSLGGQSTSTNGELGVLRDRFVAESDFSYLLLRVSNSLTGTNSWDNIKLLPSVKDSIGNLHLDIVDAPVFDQPSLVATEIDGSVEFDGTNDALSRDISDFRSTDTEGSIEAWFQTTAGGENCIFSSSDTASASYFTYIAVTDGKIRVRARINTTDNDLATTITNQFNDGKPHHLVLTSDNSTYKVYVDGEERSLTVTAGANDGNWMDWVTDRDNVVIGALTYSAGTLVYFNGNLSHVAYYNYGLSASAIKTHYAAGQEAGYRGRIVADGPVNYWRLGDLSGSVVAEDEIGTDSLDHVGNPTLENPGLVASNTNFSTAYNGVNQYSTKNVADYRTSDTTGSVELWFKTSKVMTDRRYMFCSGDNATTTLFWLVGLSENGEIRTVNQNTSANTYVRNTNDTGFDDGEVHHLVVTYAGGATSNVYVDGILRSTYDNGSNGTAPPWFNSLSGTDIITIGAIVRSDIAQHFPGVIDEVAVYNYALSGRQVLDHYLEGSAPTNNVSGNLTAQDGTPGDAVCFFTWEGRQAVATFFPDANGDWEGQLNPGEYGVTYLAAGCRPQTYGPYTVV